MAEHIEEASEALLGKAHGASVDVDQPVRVLLGEDLPGVVALEGALSAQRRLTERSRSDGGRGPAWGRR